MNIRTLIVDDEPLARERIRRLLEQEHDFEVIGEAADGAAAVEAISTHRPDLVFLDVQMPQLDGFSVVETIGPEQMPTIVFVTAYDEFALRAFDAHALDYLHKPFAVERFEQALARVRTTLGTRRGGDLEARLRRLLEHVEARSTGSLERFVIRSGARLRFVTPEEVDWIAAEGNYLRLHTASGSHLIRETMGRLETQLDHRKFVRIHRSTMVNVGRVREVESVFQGAYVVVLNDGTKLASSRAFRRRLEGALSIGNA